MARPSILMTFLHSPTNYPVYLALFCLTGCILSSAFIQMPPPMHRVKSCEDFGGLHCHEGVPLLRRVSSQELLSPRMTSWEVVSRFASDLTTACALLSFLVWVMLIVAYGLVDLVDVVVLPSFAWMWKTIARPRDSAP